MLGIEDPTACTDATILNLWHPLGALIELALDGHVDTTYLLGEHISIRRSDGQGIVAVRTGYEDAPLPTRDDFGYLWTCLGTPPETLFEIPEYAESGRTVHNTASIGVHTSAPRAVENFLDLAHFMTVHAGSLGDEPFTEIPDYDVEVVDGEIWAKNCRAYQPQAAPGAESGAMIEYMYRVPHPYCAILYKMAADSEQRPDIYTVFMQAMTQEWSKLHMLTCIVDTGQTTTQVRDFVQGIVAEDKPILENQLPKRLPLDPRVEIPMRVDKSSVAYRRMLRDMGVSYAVTAAPDGIEQ